MSKIIKNKKSKEVEFVFPNEAMVSIGKDSKGKNRIEIPNYPPARIEGKTRYLGGTVIANHALVEALDIIEDVQNVPEDWKEKKYKYDKKTKVFTAV